MGVARSNLRTGEINRHECSSRYNDEEKHQAIHQRMEDVRYIARKIHKGLPYHVSFEDLLHDGVVGLIDAAQKYDLARETSFRTYAKFRIQGAILDSMRQMDLGPRSLRREHRRLERARQKLTTSLGRYPAQSELATELGMSVQKFQRLLAKIESLRVSSLSSETGIDKERRPLIESLRATGESNPLTCLLKSERKDLLLAALEKLSAVDRKVLSLYYFEEYSLKEVGKVMGFSEARASQIRSRAISKVKGILTQLTDMQPDLPVEGGNLQTAQLVQL